MATCNGSGECADVGLSSVTGHAQLNMMLQLTTTIMIIRMALEECDGALPDVRLLAM